jgi:PAS domain S-box-containing protein
MDASLIVRHIFDTTRDGVLITDADNRIVDVNEAFSRASGYHRDELLGKSPVVFKSGHHDADFYQEMWRALAESGRWQGEIWDRRKNDEVFLQLLTITAITDAEGTKQGYLAVFTDIHQLHLAMNRVQQLMHFDTLTELPNRNLFLHRLEQAIAGAERANHLLAIILLDMDGFKAINEHYGHTTGDNLQIGRAHV